ncbi:hypothetical protein ACFSR7_16120 [Cohnella sp. GCM10020058]|uniref:hypothetical protein n=1 Tax=Cohnella sp. GCM10020058 TaxID=3317330 RepID=UPI00363095C7
MSKEQVSGQALTSEYCKRYKLTFNISESDLLFVGTIIYFCWDKKWGEEMSSKKMGRPPSDNPKSETIKIRMDQDTMKKLDASAVKLNTTRSDIVRKGIEKVYDELQK